MTIGKELTVLSSFHFYCINIPLHIFFNILTLLRPMQGILALTILLLCLPQTSALIPTLSSPYSWVQSLEVAFYQFQPDPSASLVAPLGPPGYISVTLTFQDDFPNIYKTAIVLGGLQNSGNNVVAFTIEEVPASATSSSMDFKINLYSTTKLGYISFFYVIVATNSYFEIINGYQTGFSLPSSSPLGNVDFSVQFPELSSWGGNSSNIRYKFYLQSFQLDCSGAGTGLGAVADECVVGVKDKTTSAPADNGKFVYVLLTDNYNVLYEVYFTIICYNSSLLPSIYYDYGFVTNDFADLITLLNTDTNGLAFKGGLNPKCLLGFNSLTFQSSSFSLIYDMTKDYPDITSVSYYTHVSTFSMNLSMLCIFQQKNCSQIDGFCRACITQSICSDCTNPYYVDNGGCAPCNTPLPGCIHCENSSICLQCNTPVYYFDTANDNCMDCFTYLPHCENCSVITACIQCYPGYGLNNATSCLACGMMITNCELCMNSTYCYQCVSGYYVQYSNHSCMSCSIIGNCLTCSNSTYCITCIDDFTINPDNSGCHCTPGLYPVTGFCSVLGCISAYKFSTTTTTVCLACDTSKYFVLTNQTCLCSTGFTLNNVTCTEICGDGRVINAACDDGNLINGDGCSSQCIIQSSYSCVNGSLNSASKCVYISQLNPSLTHLMKVQDMNQFYIVLTVADKRAPLDEMNLNQYIKLSIGSINYTNFSASYDNKAGAIQIYVNYYSHIQGLPITLTVNYDPALFSLSSSTLSFDAKGENMALLNYSQPVGHQSIVESLNIVIAVFALIQLLASAPFHKIIGAETFQITQIVFFTRFLVTGTQSETFQSANSMKYINFYNFFSPYTNVRSLDGTLMRMGLTRTFLFNIILQIALLVLVWVLFKIFDRKYLHLKRLNIIDNTTFLNLFMRYKYLSYIFANYIFTLTITSFMVVVFSYLSATQSSQQLTESLPSQFIILNMAIFCYSTMYLCKELYNNFRDAKKYNQEEGSYYRYLTVFLIYSTVITLLSVGGAISSNGKYVIAVVELAYLIFIIIYKPYFLNMHNIVLIGNQSIVLLFTTLMILNDFMSTLSQFRGYIMIGLDMLLGVVNILGFVRLYVHHKYNVKAFEKMKIDAEKAKAGIEKVDFSLKQIEKNKKISNNLPNSKLIKQSIQTKKDIEETTLRRLKNRLRQQHQKQKCERILQENDDE